MSTPEEPTTGYCIATIDELVDLLRGEISLLERGDLLSINETLERKKALLERVEAITPKLQSELAGGAGLAILIRDKLKGVRDLLERNMSMIQGLANASKGISDELKRIENRHSLRGLYGADGAKRDATPPRSRARLDRSV